jgi:isoleucyl-tRNA synthetase
MEDWLHNMGDWNISRKRFYGLPLPFYPCDNCGTLSVVGSKDELNKLSGQNAHDIPELHRPWIDDTQIKCPNCGFLVSRVPDVGDVWLDAGIVPFTTLNYFEDRESWKEYFPVEWIAEMREQVRLWFYSMLFMGVTLEHRSPYERVLAYESVVSEDGTRFSKTGYMIQFDKAVEKVGADTMRYLFCGANITNNVRFGYGLGFEIQRRLLSFWNAYLFFKTYASLDQPEIAVFIPSVDNLTVTDKWLITRTNTFLETVSTSFDEYLTPNVIKEFEAFVDDLSNWYIRINRRRFWKSEDSQDKKVAYWCLYNALCVTTQVMAPIIPYMTEEIWQNAIRLINSKAPISVHLSQWPEPLMDLKDDDILEQTAVVRNIISLALRLRNQEQIKVRQPLLSMFIIVDESKQEAVEKMKEILLNEINVKSIHFLKNLNTLEFPLIKLDFQKAGPILKKDVQNVNELLNSLSEQQKSDIAEQYESGDSINIPGWQEPLPTTLFVREFQPKEGIVVLTEGEILLALDTKIPDYLKLEGFVRELVRKIQVFRKDSGLRVEQRISIGIQTSSQELQKAVLTHKEYIAEETLAENVNFDLENPLFKKNLKISNYQVEISIALL